jgi:hypothetical protein
MSTAIAQFVPALHSLIYAGQNLDETLADSDVDPILAAAELEAAVNRSESAVTRRRFDAAAAPGEPEASTDEDFMAGALLDLQSANLLLAASIATNEYGGGGDRKFLRASVENMEVTRVAVQSAIAPRPAAWAAEENASVDLEAAKTRFRTSARRALNSVVDGTGEVIGTVGQEMRKLDGAEVLEAIGALGKQFDAVAAVGRLAKAGFDRLKAVLDKLSGLFENEALAGVKKRVEDVWQKIKKREYARDVLRWLVDAKMAEGLASAVVLAAALLGFFSTVAPWVPLASAAAYVAVIGGALVVAAAYTGEGPLFGWVRGVRVIIEEACPPAR